MKASKMAMRALVVSVAVMMLAIVISSIGTTSPDKGDTAPAASAANRASVLGSVVARAGGDMEVEQGELIILDGSRSTSNVTIVNLTWIFDDSGPVVLYGLTPTHRFMTLGTILVTLTVTDVDLDTSTDSLLITVLPDTTPPEVTLWNRTIAPGQSTVITLDGSKCYDNVGIVNYTWYCLYRGDDIWLYGESPVFDFKKPGTYLVVLNATDAAGNWATGTLTVDIQREPSIFVKQWVLFFIVLPIVAIAAYMVFSKWRKGAGLITRTDVEKARLQIKNFRNSWKVFRANRLGMFGFTILIVFVIIAVFAPFLSAVDNPQTDVEPNRINNVADTTDDWFNPLPPSFSPSPYTGIRHILGTDSVGKDVYSLTIYGTRASLEVGLVATLISVVLGTLIGLGAGYFGRVTDEALMRLTDFFLVLPWFPLMIVMMSILGQKFVWVVLVIGITSWPSTARVVRSQVLTIKERQFIVRARAVGSGDSHIIRTHILPNVLPLIFANTVLLIAIAIFSEAFLDFFGLGDPSVISWGSMLEAAYDQAAFAGGAWWWIAAPGAAIVIMVLAFSLVGYAIDDVLNPKLRKR